MLAYPFLGKSSTVISASILKDLPQVGNVSRSFPLLRTGAEIILRKL